MTILNQRVLLAASLVSGVFAASCGSSDTPKTDAELQQEIASSMKTLVQADIRGLNQAARDLQAAAPLLAQDWDPAGGGTALATMQQAWTGTRAYWEHAEGTLSLLFPDLDESMDSRYEDSLVARGGVADPDPFDGQGVIGMHAIERILFAPGPQEVSTYESSLAGYSPALWPATDQEAADFKTGLCQRLVDDTQLLLDRWGQQTIDLSIVFSGLVGLMSAQAEKVSLAAQLQQESRYSQTTMADLRSNLAGTRAVYELFVPWLDTKPYGTALNDNARQAFAMLDDSYSAVSGDAIPAPPDTWGSNPPLLDDLHSPFGTLYLAVVLAVDPTRAGSAVDAMNHVAWALGLPEVTGQN